MKPVWTAILILGVVVTADGCSRRDKATPDAGDAKASATPPGGEKVAPGKRKRGTFTVGKPTTYVTGPLDADGRIDYAAALNERLSKGVTPEHNAAVLIWKALGPNPVGNTPVPSGFFDKLGIPAPPPNGEYFVSLDSHMRRHGGDGSAATELLSL